jgi:hypothetical protein
MTFKQTELESEESKFETHEKFLKWLDERISSYEGHLAGKDVKQESCMNCALVELRGLRAKAKLVKSME